MTQPHEDPWATASAAVAAGSGATSEAPSQALPPQEDEAESQLFSGGLSAPSLLNKTHFLGAVRAGIITKAPYDRQKIDFESKMPLFWSDNNEPKPLSEGGDRNQPVMNTLLELSTEYTMDAAETAAIGRDEPWPDGERVFTAGGADLKALKKAIKVAGITSGKQMVGKRLTVKRAGQRPTKGSPAWVLEITITDA